MLGQLAALGVIAIITPLTSANAIVTNYCWHDIYLWSVPSDTHEMTIHPGASYIETFHRGESNPGIALKISSKYDGIYSGGDELTFAYTVDPHNDTKVWLNVDSTRGDPFGGDYRLLGCFGSLERYDNTTKDCSVDEEAKLMVCASNWLADGETHFGKHWAGQKVHYAGDSDGDSNDEDQDN